MKPYDIAAGIIAGLAVAAAGSAYASADGTTHGDGWGGRYVRTTTLVPKIAPQSPSPAPQSRHAPPPHSSMSPPQHRPAPRAPFGPGGFPRQGGFPHYRPYIAPPPIIVPRYLPPPAYYGYGPVPYVAPPSAYYEYSPPAYVAPPPTYVERDDGYWYYCEPLDAYYPDVTQCPAQWIPVPPR